MAYGGIQWSRERWRHVAPKLRQTRDQIYLRAQYLEKYHYFVSIIYDSWLFVVT